MSSDVMAGRCEAHVVGVGRLRDYRLAFTRASVSRQGGAADIVAAPGFVVFGVVYEVEESALSVLDRREGHPRAYARTTLDVDVDGKPRSCVAYTVAEKVFPELQPTADYLDLLVQGAREHGLPNSYQAFLRSLASHPSGEFRTGLAILPTTGVRKRRLGVLELHPETKRALALGRVAVVEVGKRRCLVDVRVDGTLEREQCRLDQNVRNAVGAPGQYAYGTTASVHPCASRVVSFPLVRPRFHVMPIHVPARLDSEKNIAVLHPNSISLLGLGAGDYARLRTVVRRPDGDFVVRSLTIRVFPGSARDRQAGTDYPDPRHVYVDADGRRELGLDVHERGTPAIVTADVRKLILSRALPYAITYFVGLTGLAASIESISAVWGGDVGRGWTLLLALLVAGLLTTALAVVDIRARVQS